MSTSPTGGAAAVAELLQPADEHDRRLLEHVRPPDWVNPKARERYHLVVIGGGTAGLVSAAIAAALGARVALVERHLLGGDCLNTGCVPSKAVLRAARAWAEAAAAAGRFGGPRVAGPGDFAAVMERMRRLRAEIAAHDSAARFRDLGVDVFLGEARFRSPDEVEVGGERLRFRRAVIATGSRPTAPPIAGLAEAGYLSNETVFSLTELPPRLATIGAGPIGCELAQAFARFGSRVTLLEVAPRILPGDDADAAAVVDAALRRDGVAIECGARIDRVEVAADVREIRYEIAGAPRRLHAERLLVAAGRAPNVEALDLERAGVDFHADGVAVDARLRTTNRRVYAIGDVASAHRFTHAADAQARLVVRNALFFGRGRADRLIIPWCTYTSPELAHVGISADDARGNPAVESLTVHLHNVDRARLDGAEDGFLRLHLHRRSGRILGATLVAEHAGEIIAQLTQAMTIGSTLARVGETIFPYPTQAEAIRRAADAFRRRSLTPRARSFFDFFFRLFR